MYRILKTPLQVGSPWDSLKSPSANSCSSKYSLKELLHIYNLQEMLVKFIGFHKRKAKFFVFTTFSYENFSRNFQCLSKQPFPE